MSPNILKAQFLQQLRFQQIIANITLSRHSKWAVLSSADLPERHHRMLYPRTIHRQQQAKKIICLPRIQKLQFPMPQIRSRSLRPGDDPQIVDRSRIETGIGLDRLVSILDRSRHRSRQMLSQHLQFSPLLLPTLHPPPPSFSLIVQPSQCLPFLIQYPLLPPQIYQSLPLPLVRRRRARNQP